MDARTKINVAIRQACIQWKRLATSLLRLDPREKPGINTLAVDPQLYLYYDPEWVDAQTMDDLIYYIKAETAGPILKHFVRSQRLIHGTEGSLRKKCLEFVNRASDLAINQIMRDDGQYIAPAAAQLSNIYDADGDPLPDRLSMEEYYRLIYTEMEDEDEDGDGDGDGESFDPQPHMGGSGADGEARDWDDPGNARVFGKPESQDYAPDSNELDDLTSDFISKGSDSMGREGGGEMSRLVDKKKKPKVSPASLLRGMVSRITSCFQRGTQEQTYSRPSRRRTSGEFIFPSWRARKPKVCIVVDTSGSMSSEDLALAAGVIESALKDLRLDGVRIVGADVDIRSDQKNVKDMRSIKLGGYGGTRMDYVCNKIASSKKDRPDVIILATDGYTDWPSNNDIPTVACITTAEDVFPERHTPSEWIKYIFVRD